MAATAASPARIHVENAGLAVAAISPARFPMELVGLIRRHGCRCSLACAVSRGKCWFGRNRITLQPHLHCFAWKS
uniref:Uncharacterized protein n=1 Tax=Angiostrongylus cantonensis TaxID=6313 RepID=A0A0K0DA76_ANGCA